MCCIDINAILGIIISCVGVIIAVLINARQKKSETIRYLARQIQLYNREEKLLIQTIHDLQTKFGLSKDSVNTIKKQFRGKVNTERFIIKETEQTVRKFL